MHAFLQFHIFCTALAFYYYFPLILSKKREIPNMSYNHVYQHGEEEGAHDWTELMYKRTLIKFFSSKFYNF